MGLYAFILLRVERMLKLFLIIVVVHCATALALSKARVSSPTTGAMKNALNCNFNKDSREVRHCETRVTAAAVAVPAAAPIVSPVTAASLRAVAKLLSTVGLGGYASRQGMLDKNALQVLSKLVFGLLQPCMLFCKCSSDGLWILRGIYNLDFTPSCCVPNSARLCYW